MRVGVVRNPRSHANKGRVHAPTPEGVRVVEPATREELSEDLARFADEKIDLLVIDGGDGTVRDVLGLTPATFGDDMPLLAVVPSGKTNVLAIDLGAPRDWRLEEALAAAGRPEPRIKLRAPLEVRFADGRPPLRGFFFGLGAFVRATALSKRVNRMGVFQSLSVAVTLIGATIGALLGGARDQWRQGVAVKVAIDGEPQPEGERFVLLATALKRLPFGLRPFGPPREGLKVLDVDAPPERLLRMVPTVLAGKPKPILEARGYRRRDPAALYASGDFQFVLDGEVFEGGKVAVALGAPLRFVVG
ncbi:MAG: diacylglycerol kinase family protein [Caulobacter sp.]